MGFYTGKQPLAFHRHLADCCLIFNGRPNLDKAIKAIVAAVESGAGLPEKLFAVSAESEEAMLELNDHVRADDHEGKELLNRMMMRAVRNEGPEEAVKLIDMLLSPQKIRWYGTMKQLLAEKVEKSFELEGWNRCAAGDVNKDDVNDGTNASSTAKLTRHWKVENVIDEEAESILASASVDQSSGTGTKSTVPEMVAEKHSEKLLSLRDLAKWLRKLDPSIHPPAESLQALVAAFPSEDGTKVRASALRKYCQESIPKMLQHRRTTDLMMSTITDVKGHSTKDEKDEDHESLFAGTMRDLVNPAVKKELSMWQTMYCGGSEAVLRELTQVCKELGMSLQAEKFDW